MRLTLSLRKTATVLLPCLLMSAVGVPVYASESVLERALHLEQPKQTLLKSLIHIGQKSDISIIAPSHIIRGLPAPALVGEYTPKEALSHLLEDSGLYFQEISANVVAIKPIKRDNVELPPQAYVLEEVSVIGRPITGSRLRRMDVEGSSPVDIISGNDIAISGSQTLGEFLKYMTAVSGNSTSTSVSNGGDGSATVTLRGMPANNTLVLLNGKRIANKGLRGDSVDLNTIPPAAIERVEILKDGASAIYGSDAIAGVVNIIMKNDFDGLHFDQYYGVSSRGDMQTKTSNLLWGAGNLSSSILLSASLSRQNGLLSRERPLSSTADGREQGGVDLRSSATPDPRITLPDGRVVMPSGSGTYNEANDEDLYDYSAFTSTVSPSEHDSLYLAASHSTDNILLQLTAGYTSTSAEITFAPAPIFTAFERHPITVSAGQYFNPFDADLTDVRRRVTELSTRTQHDETENWRFGLSAESQWRDYNWQISANWSKANSEQFTSNILDGERVTRALSDNCLGAEIDGCTPLDLFGPEGSISQAQLDYVTTSTFMKGSTELFQYNIDVDTSWSFFAGDLLAAAGMELREEKVNTGPVNHDAGAYLIGGDDISQVIGERDTFEVYVETQIPLAYKTRFAYSLTLELSTRMSDYSDFGFSSNPKLGFRYRPVHDLLLRGTYTSGFRAPSISELHREGSIDLPFLNDPCSQIENVGVLPGCSQLADPTRFQFLTEFSGEEALKPEKSRNKTLGLVWTPSARPNLSFSMDYFNIDQNDVVDASAQFLVDQNALSNRFSEQVHRDAAGNIAKIDAPFMNLGSRNIEGIDISMGYQWKKGAWGVFKLSLDAAHLKTYDHRLSISEPRGDLAGTFSDEASEGSGALPDWKVNTGLNWSRGGMELNYTVHFISRLKEDIPDTGRTRHIKPAISHDIQVSYQPQALKSLQLAMGVDNLFDASAPFSAAAFNDNYDSRTHDIRGQFWYARMAYNFY